MNDKRWLVRGGALLVMLGFVLPSMMVSCSGFTMVNRSFSLFDLASLAEMPILYLIPLGALVVLILAFLPKSLGVNQAALFWGQIAGAVLGLISILVEFLSMNNQLQQVGFDITPQIGMFSLLGGYLLIGIGLSLQWPEINRVLPQAPPISVNQADKLPGEIFKIQEPPPKIIEPAGNYLRVLNGDLDPEIIPIDSDYFTIGRNFDCDLYLEDRTVSHQHARLRYAAGAWYIQDQDSLAGIYVNDQKVPAKRLNSGDRITIGDYTFEFNCQ